MTAKKQTVELSVIVPLFNEEGILWRNLSAIGEHLDKIIGKDRWQFIMVDNGSTDDTPNIVNKAIETWPQSLKVNLPKPNYGAALRAGIDAAQCDYAHIINIDFWDAPVMSWSWENRQDYDMIIASKRSDPTINKQDRYRRILSWGLNTALNMLFDFNGTDTHGPKMLYLPKIKSIIDKCIMDRGQFDTEFTIKAFRQGLRLCEIPVPYAEQRTNRNFMLKKILWNVQDIFKLRKIIHAVPWAEPLNYRRFSYRDVLHTNEMILDSKTTTAKPKTKTVTEMPKKRKTK